MSEEHPSYPGLRWLEPNENAFGVRALDCRPAHPLMKPFFDLNEWSQMHSKMALSDGSNFRFTSPPDAVTTLCVLEYPLPGDGLLPEGPLFTPNALNENWFVFHFGKEIVFVNYLQGAEEYRAHFRREHDKIVVDHLTYWDRYSLRAPSYSLRVADFLFKSYFYGRAVPHPIPLQYKDWPPDPLAEYSYFEYGRRAVLATFEDTLDLSWRDMDNHEFMGVK